MDDTLLEVLVDPLDGTNLRLARPQRSALDDNELISESGHKYPVVAGIPRFVPRDTYSESFGFEWNRFARLQLDSVNGLGDSVRRWDEETDWSADILSGATVVDAGCGAGRFAEIAAQRGARVFAVDMSSAVDVAGRNLARFPNVHVIQADIRNLPLRPQAITHLYSIGVLQHTPDPVATARSLVQFLDGGARFTLTAYGRRVWTKLNGKYLLRPLTRRLRPETTLRAVERLMPLAFPISDRLFRLPRAGRFWRFAIPVANYVGTPGKEAPREHRYAEAILDTFDALSPRYDDPLVAKELVEMLQQFADVTVVSNVPVVVRGTRRPAVARATPEAN